VLGSVLGEPKEAAGRNIQVNAIQAQPDARRLYELGQDVARGEFTIPIAKVFRLEEARKAQDFAEHEHPKGKVLMVA
jgi:NADPH:quinone reductase-like Zn-dependent oxidoreductase